MLTEQEFHDDGIVPAYLAAATLMTSILPVSLALRSIRGTGRFLPAMTFVGVVVAVFWLAIPPLIWLGFLAYTHASPYEIMQLSLGILAGAVVLSIPYSMWLRRERN